jgi:DNA oxidative demethylase
LEIARMNAFPDGFRYVPGRFDAEACKTLLGALRDVIATAPLFVPTMPRTAKPFGVRMTNCGPLGWVSDQERGYRYQSTHPVTGAPWPPIPAILLELWADLAGYPAPPEACLVNYYGTGTKMGSHVDADEQDFSAPVISISLGDDATFHVGGLARSDPKHRIRLCSGDVVVLGGAARRAYHGIDRVFAGTSTLLAEGGRINLTLRRVTRMTK